MEISAALRRGGAIVLGPVSRAEQAHALLDREAVEATLSSDRLLHADASALRLSAWCLPSLLLSLCALPMQHPLRCGRPQLVLPSSEAQLHQAVAGVLLPPAT